MSSLSDAVRNTGALPPWPSVDLTGDLHPSPVVHDALRGIPGALVERALRDGGDWRAAVGPAGVIRVLTLWPMYLLAAHQVRVLHLLYPESTDHNVWEGDPSAVPLDLSRVGEAEELYARKFGDPYRQYQRRLLEFQEWSR
jgi:hypothetical protein